MTATAEDSGASAPRNPDTSDDDDGIFGRLIGLAEVRLLVGIDQQLQAIDVVVEGLPIPISLVMAPKSAVRLQHKLARAVTRLAGVTP